MITRILETDDPVRLEAITELAAIMTAISDIESRLARIRVSLRYVESPESTG